MHPLQAPALDHDDAPGRLGDDAVAVDEAVGPDPEGAVASEAHHATGPLGGRREVAGTGEEDLAAAGDGNVVGGEEAADGEGAHRAVGRGDPERGLGRG